MIKRNILVLLALLLFTKLQAQIPSDFVKRDGEQLTLKGKPYYYVGTNYWYGSILASTGEGGDRERLVKELDFMKKNGITNLRILAGAEGPNNQPYRATPGLQMSPGVYNDTILAGLDFLLAEMGKRDMKAVLYLNNSWEWSGGFSQYLNWNGYGEIPYALANNNDWAGFMRYAGQFHNCEPCKEQFGEYIKFLLSRTNQFTNKKYTDDSTIMAWQIANEPRAFSKENLPAFEEWISNTAALIKSVDKNHLVSTGSEGQHGTEESMEVYKRIHADPNIDYLNMHIWPKNWGWLDSENISGTIDNAIAETKQYMNDHIAVARELNKPIVMEEFGLPRDNHTYSLDDKTTNRDKYYQYVFSRVLQSAKEGGTLAGCNFWAFGGTARPNPDREFWQNGDDLMGDPPQEEQGLNSVFDKDTTIKVVAKYSKAIKSATKGKKK
ncbi:cellulase family glycosylhydrolase [Pontibacter silvestris]|uniref:mannan endo-1,4-beta-mannosidase n=1 Tax=Pontibacter silvestris TaxID=2305183 RepID=A0ABW4WZ22_9BACT|nr:cellulase family glycosylhydrolase [Pontibacter silvestris]MCC9137608.1 cellulase family glycosylhydrolase [Pontibacter silvestris]